MNPSTAKQLRIWLYLVAVLITVMVLVGGATRLTESGLSITEWKPVAGALPPMSETQWQGEFEKYQATTQYHELNRGMALQDFKKIYWWEWAHRFLGRFIGIAFALPFFFFALTKRLPRPLLWKLGGILLLGGLQGAIGWWMVASGLVNRVNVAPYRLAIHLTLALFIFVCILKVATSLRAQQVKAEFNKPWSYILLGLIFVQVFLGALVAGNRAGYTYNTWPLMDGGFIPSNLFVMEPWWRNLFENTALVQFMHRCMAYLLFMMSLGLLLKNPNRNAAHLFGIVIIQAGLGIATLLSGMNIGLALTHQAVALGLLSFVTLKSYSAQSSGSGPLQQ
ncbi:MAG: COX15/CtaA family protein [Pseudomonadota bacterium]